MLARMFPANRTPAAVRALVRPSLHRAMFATYYRTPWGSWVAEHFERDTLTSGEAVYMGRVSLPTEQAALDFIAVCGARLPRRVRYVRPANFTTPEPEPELRLPLIPDFRLLFRAA
jgi:hypothetical protein